MASAYPGGLDSFATNKADGTATPTDHPTHHNDLADAVNKIEAELGISPSGALATLVARLPTVVRKAADETVTSSITLQDDDELLFAIGASETWVVFAYLFIDGNTAGDILVTLAVPAGATGSVGMLSTSTASTTFENSSVNNQALAFGTGMPGGTLGAGNKAPLFMLGSIVNSTTPGNVTLQWAQRVSSATATTVFAGSFLVAYRIS